jgi:hypothetical protein
MIPILAFSLLDSQEGCTTPKLSWYGLEREIMMRVQGGGHVRILHCFQAAVPASLFTAGLIRSISRILLGLDITLVAAEIALISASIVIYGPNATADMSRKWQDAINYYWNNEGKGFTINGKKVSVNVTVTADPQANWWFTAQSADNVIYVNEPGVQSWVWGPFGAWYGRWRSDADALTVAHETGHLFGLPDEYDEFWGTPKPGHEGEIMTDQPGSTVSQREIESVVGSNCGCK